ncbi:MAG TPA: hypothetical protein VIW24_15815 [Aldersonia sp.]
MKLRTRAAILAVLVGGALVPAACSPPPPVSGIVVGKDTRREHCGKRGSCTDYDVTVQTPDGGFVVRDVSGDTYDRLNVGQRVDGLVR